jgi:hypothetical protein
MNQDKRVLSRRGARNLTAEETKVVSGAIHVTTQLCTILTTAISVHGPGDGGCDGGETDV